MIVVLMGVAGSGKTTVGQLLSHQLDWEFADADDFHPSANVEKMTRGVPLTDADRIPWLARLRELILAWMAEGKSGVVACSALKESYREQLRVGPEVRIVFLKGSPELLQTRLAARSGHYMKAAMLSSQLATLEEPTDAITIDASGTVDEVVGEVRRSLRL